MSEHRACRVCGCTDGAACAGGCSWVDADLCSRCAGPTSWFAPRDPAPVPGLPPTLARYTAALGRHGSKQVRITYRVVDLSTLAGIVQMALRHPALAPSTHPGGDMARQTAELFVMQAREILDDLDPAFGELLDAGANPENDRPPTDLHALAELAAPLAEAIEAAWRACEEPHDTRLDLARMREDLHELTGAVEVAPLSGQDVVEQLQAVSSGLLACLQRREETSPVLLGLLAQARGEAQKFLRTLADLDTLSQGMHP